MIGPELGRRVLYCRWLLGDAQGQEIATLREFAEAVATEYRRLVPDVRRAPPSSSTVLRWQRGESEMDLLTIMAITEAVNRALAAANRPERIDPGWVAFGALCAVPEPEMPQLGLVDVDALRLARRGGRGGTRG